MYGRRRYLPSDKYPVPGIRAVTTKYFVRPVICAPYKRLVVPVPKQVACVAVGSVVPVGVPVGSRVVLRELLQAPYSTLCLGYAVEDINLRPNEGVDKLGVIPGVLVFPHYHPVFVPVVCSTEGNHGFRMEACV